MKWLAALVAALGFTLPGHHGGSAVPQPSVLTATSIPIEAGSYRLLGPALGGANVVETTYWPTAAGVDFFYGCAAFQTCLIHNFQPRSTEADGNLIFSARCRFNYVFSDRGVIRVGSAPIERQVRSMHVRVRAAKAALKGAFEEAI